MTRPNLAGILRVALAAGFGAVIAIGCGLRFWKLTGVGLWYDELWTVVGSSDRSFMEMYREWILGDPHPPGYFLFSFAYFKVFPNDELWARLPSALAGVTTVGWVAFAGRQLFSAAERVMSASFVALSHTFIYYSLTAKQYSAVLLLVTIATLSYLQLAEARRFERSAGTSFCIALVGLAWLNYFATAYAGLLFVLLLFALRRDPAEMGRALRAGALVALACLPLTYFQYLMLKYTPGDWQHDSLHTLLADWLPNLFFIDPQVSLAAAGLLTAAVASLAARPGARRALSNSRNARLLVVLGSTLGFLLLAGVFKPVYFIRYFLIAFPAFLLATGVLAAAAFPLNGRATLLAVLPLAFFTRAALADFRQTDGLVRQHWDKSVDLVIASAGPNDVVCVLGASQDKTMFDYLKAGSEFGVYYVRNLKFYQYYFRRRNAWQLADRLEVVQPSAQSASDLISRYRQSGRTVWILGGHHIKYDDDALVELQRNTTHFEATQLFSTRVYKAVF